MQYTNEPLIMIIFSWYQAPRLEHGSKKIEVAIGVRFLIGRRKLDIAFIFFRGADFKDQNKS